MTAKKFISITEDDIIEAGKKNHVDQNSRSSYSRLNSWNPYPPLHHNKTPLDIILCIDTSGSMEAEDYPPTRLNAAKDAAINFSKRKVIQGYKDRVGIIGFGGNPTLFHPLDDNLEKVSTSIKKLAITHSGTMVGEAIKLAKLELDNKGKYKRAIILLSDGGDSYDTSDPVSAARTIPDIKIFTIGIGTLKGGKVSLPTGVQKVHLNEKILKQIAMVSRGEYLYAPDIFKLIDIYKKLADY